MTKVIASISTSVDGYVVGPDDHAGQGLGVGGERLHYWVMGGPWTYDSEHDTDGMHGPDKEFFDSLTEELGSTIVGRTMYECAGAWGGTNPFPGTLVVLTHRVEDQPDPSAGFLFIDGFDAALSTARELAGEGAVALGGGADLIRQGLAAGVVDELAISTAPVVLGGGKRLFEGFEQDLDLEVLGVWTSPYATHVRYCVQR
ncbi:MAG TPA: dihydrofolate reductase family protein [Ornithinibacter sp.]|nr:dihydrofolate reductase family protein [Ornithinibacter sp.]